MKITSTEFITSAAQPEQFLPADAPEVAFAGRSNVGKSTLLNHLVNRRGLARTSSRPGKTQLVNFFLINDEFRLVDLPGYGYAKVPKLMREAWGKLMQTYLEERPCLELLVLLLDSRRAPSALDISMWEWVTHFNVPAQVVLTKADKLSKSELAKQRAAIARQLGASPDKLLPYSATANTGRDELWSIIFAHVME